jgi:GMP reductase
MTKLDFNDVLIEPRISDQTLSRKDIDIEINGKIPVIVSNMLSTGTYKIAKIAEKHKFITFLNKEYNIESYIENLEKLNRSFIGITTGVVSEKEKERAHTILSMFDDIGYLNIDIANAYANMDGMERTIKDFKSKFPNIIISAGNVATDEGAERLKTYGADLVKVGVGSGAACRTRSEVGVGVPQFSAILDTHEHSVISDGGCVTSGDICKAIAAGAQYVMIGGMLSHCRECDNIIQDGDKQYVNFYGLGSSKMYSVHKPSDIEYRPNEGRDLYVPVTDSVENVFKQIKGALRSACTYVGVKNINELKDKANFIQVNNILNRSLEKYERLF